MEMTGERLLPAPRDVVWKALNDPALLQRSIAGCEAFEANGDDAYKATVAVKIGPVSARFNADVSLTNIQAPNAYTINFDGKGGVAGFGKGSADIVLSDEANGTKLTYSAKAQVGGKLAQIGSRLIDAASAKLTEEFFTAFEKEVALLHTPPVAALDTAGPLSQGGAAATEQPTTVQATTVQPTTPKAAPSSVSKLVWGVGTGLVIWLLWTLIKK